VKHEERGELERLKGHEKLNIRYPLFKLRPFCVYLLHLSYTRFLFLILKGRGGEGALGAVEASHYRGGCAAVPARGPRRQASAVGQRGE